MDTPISQLISVISDTKSTKASSRIVERLADPNLISWSRPSKHLAQMRRWNWETEKQICIRELVINGSWTTTMLLLQKKNILSITFTNMLNINKLKIHPNKKQNQQIQKHTDSKKKSKRNWNCKKDKMHYKIIRG